MHASPQLSLATYPAIHEIEEAFSSCHEDLNIGWCGIGFRRTGDGGDIWLRAAGQPGADVCRDAEVRASQWEENSSGYKFTFNRELLERDGTAL